MTEASQQPIVAGPLDLPADGSEPTSWRYLPSLDGVRGLAVVAVVLFHYWPDSFPGGFVGVDVFFAMSGFLITGILVSEHRRDGRIDLGAFWGRRVRRLVPAVVVLVVVTALAAVLTDTGSSRQLADSVGALTWTTNLIEAWFGGSQMWLHNSRTTLDHLWSLAIEEQFYLVWPLMALAILRWVPDRRRQVAVVLALVVASATSMGLVGGLLAYFRTDTRAFELLAGAALALSGWGSVRRSPRLTSALAVGGVGGLALFVALVDPGDDWMYPWGFLLISLSSVALVAAAVHPARWTAAILESPLMRHLGRVSYGIYLWHIPVLRLMSQKRIGIEGIGLQVVRFAVLAVVVEASFRYVEEPFRRRRIALGRRQFAGGYLVAFAAVALLIPATIRDYDGQWDAIDGPPGVAPGQRRVLVVGDLIGASAAAGLSEDDALAVWSLADPGCPALPALSVGFTAEFYDGDERLDVDEYCLHWRERWERGIARFRPDVVLIGGGYWDTLRVTGAGDEAQRFEDVVAAQVSSASGSGGRRPEVVLLRVDDWSELIEPEQRPIAERLASIDAYDSALQRIAAERDVRILEVSGLDGWDGLRSLSSRSLR